jgi:hypothetical protein
MNEKQKLAITDEMIDAASRELWNDRDARMGGPWEGRNPQEVCVIQTKATAKAMLSAALRAETQKPARLSAESVSADHVEIVAQALADDVWHPPLKLSVMQKSEAARFRRQASIALAALRNEPQTAPIDSKDDWTSDPFTRAAQSQAECLIDRSPVTAEEIKRTEELADQFGWRSQAESE